MLLDFVGVTEAAAVAAYPYVGKGDKWKVDDLATTAMRTTLNDMSMTARVVIGEGEIDEAPMLYIGEILGNRQGLELDLAVDPLDGTTMTAKGTRDAMTILAASPKNTLLHAPDMYMEKMAVCKDLVGHVHIDKCLEENIQAIMKIRQTSADEITVAIQDRGRHAEQIETLRRLGVKTLLFHDGDVSYAIAAAIEEDPIDLFIGTGGAPEGVISAVAVKCLGGDFQARLKPQNTLEIKRCQKMGIQFVEKALTLADLVKSDDCLFVATAVTDSYLLKGISKDSLGSYTTHSMLLHGKSQKMQTLSSNFLIPKEKQVV
ncbi:class II fructose-bisphosphatase [Shouchella patagoniensis]|uniref:class II fructose-bisphosphatase n=1 Tax=Shouchella patagoniensis TaxID=228576 RepID=UPI003461C9B9